MKIAPTTNSEISTEIKTSIETSKKNILKYVESKFPSFMLFLHICFSKYIFVCDIVVLNQTTEYRGANKLFWVYMSFIALLCFGWEVVTHLIKKNRKKCKKEKPTKKKVLYSISSATISLIAFESTIFYLDDDNVFDCYINYDETIANCVFFMSYVIILIASIVEYYYFPDLYKK